MQQGRGGMGMRKHRTSGTSGPNRRALRLLPIELLQLLKHPTRATERMYSSLTELFRKEGRKI